MMIMKARMFNLIMVMALTTMFLAAWANAAIVVTDSGYQTQGSFSAIVGDLIEGRLESFTGTELHGSSAGMLTDGTWLGGWPAGNTEGSYRPSDGSVVTYALDLDAVPAGYNIDEIISGTGYLTQFDYSVFDIEVSYIADPNSFSLIYALDMPSTLSGFWYDRQVIVSDDAGHLASDVAKIRFTFHQIVGDESIHRELDVVGNRADMASLPDPFDGEENVPANIVLSWTAGVGAVNHKVYFSSNPDPNFTGVTPAITTDPCYNPPGDLDASTTYYWRVDEDNAEPNDVIGDIWSFTTVPPKAYGPDPYDTETGVARNKVLSWQPAPGGPYNHQVYFGTAPETLLLVDTLAPEVTSYDPDLDWETPYFWRIDEDDGINPPLEGDIWSFSVGVPICDPPLQADVTGDCVIDMLDLAIMSGEWLECTLINGDCP